MACHRAPLPSPPLAPPLSLTRAPLGEEGVGRGPWWRTVGIEATKHTPARAPHLPQFLSWHCLPALLHSLPWPCSWGAPPHLSIQLLHTTRHPFSTTAHHPTPNLILLPKLTSPLPSIHSTTPPCHPPPLHHTTPPCPPLSSQQTVSSRPPPCPQPSLLTPLRALPLLVLPTCNPLPTPHPSPPQVLHLPTNTVKMGVMDEERRTSSNLAQTMNEARER